MTIEFIYFTKDLEKNPKMYPALSIPILMALTPDTYKMEITYLWVGQPFSVKDVDIVAISVLTHTAPYAYEIANKYRAQGKKVVLGGIHPSALPDEAALYADCVVIGEAEIIWKTVLGDLNSEKHKKFYKSNLHIPMDLVPKSRVDLLDPKFFSTRATIHSSRGCPYDCNYCSVTRFFGNTYRFRPISNVVDEIKYFIENDISKHRTVVFDDDNIVGNKKYARELFTELKNLDIKWVSQSNLFIGNDPELLNLAKESGCISLFVGIESLNRENLISIGKSMNNQSKYEDALKKIHDAGILILGSFIFGLDRDTDQTFNDAAEFIEKNDIEVPCLSVLTPFPGTKAAKQLEEQGRIIEKDWSKYNFRNVVYAPKNFTPEKLQDKFDELRKYMADRTFNGNKHFAERFHLEY